MAKKYRVRAYTVTNWRGPDGKTLHHPVSYQDLEVKTWLGWILVDSEIVPPEIRQAADRGEKHEWRSKFAVHGHWGPDGIIIPHTQTDWMD